MAEETSTQDATNEQEKPDEKQDDKQQETQKPDADIEAVAAKAENPDAVRNALTQERTAAREARERAEKAEAEVKKYADKDKSEQQKLEERASTAESKAEAAEKRLLRFQVAAAKNLPMDLAERLQGDTKTQLENDADRLLELVKPNGKPEGDADGGKGEAGEGGSFNDAFRRQAGYRT